MTGFVLMIGVLGSLMTQGVRQNAATCARPHARLFATAANLGIVEIDPIKGTILNTIAPPTGQGVADGLAYDGHSLYYVSGSRASNKLYALDPDTGATTGTYDLPESAFRNGLATLHGRVYILDWSAITQDITVWDPAARRMSKVLDIDGSNPEAPLISGGLASIDQPDALLVTTAMTNELLEISPSTGRITRRFVHDLPGALGVATLGQRIYVGTNTDSSLHVFDRGGAELFTVPVPGAIGFQSLAGDALDITGCSIHLPLGLTRQGRRRD